MTLDRALNSILTIVGALLILLFLVLLFPLGRLEVGHFVLLALAAGLLLLLAGTRSMSEGVDEQDEAEEMLSLAQAPEGPGSAGGCGGGCLILILLAASLFAWDGWRSRSIAFDSDAWQGCEDFRGGHAPRWRMREDVRRVIRSGMTRAKVESLLGRGERGGPVDTWMLRSDCDPPSGGSSGRPKYLYVSFNHAGLVLKSWIDY